jgi:hypothetical protein
VDCTSYTDKHCCRLLLLAAAACCCLLLLLLAAAASATAAAAAAAFVAAAAPPLLLLRRNACTSCASLRTLRLSAQRPRTRGATRKDDSDAAVAGEQNLSWHHARLVVRLRPPTWPCMMPAAGRLTESGVACVAFAQGLRASTVRQNQAGQSAALLRRRRRGAAAAGEWPNRWRPDPARQSSCQRGHPSHNRGGYHPRPEPRLPGAAQPRIRHGASVHVRSDGASCPQTKAPLPPLTACAFATSRGIFAGERCERDVSGD